MGEILERYGKRRDGKVWAVSTSGDFQLKQEQGTPIFQKERVNSWVEMHVGLLD